MSERTDRIGAWICGIIQAAAAAGLLVACVSEKRPQISDMPAVSVQCLPMASYSKAEQTQVAVELDKLPAGSELARFMVDYGALRAANRACLAVKP